jgi:hypothetical protein
MIQKIFLARDSVFHFHKGCGSKEGAADYINKWGGKGYIEIFVLKGSYYEFIDAEFIGTIARGEQRGTVFGVQLEQKRVHKRISPIILSLPEGSK